MSTDMNGRHELSTLAPDTLNLLKGVLLFDPASCNEALNVLEFLSAHDYPVSVAYVEGYRDAVLEPSSGERLVGGMAIREFLESSHSDV